MVHIDTTTSVENFRRFLINSTCYSFIPESYLRDPEVFPEKEGDAGSIYVEAADKVTLRKVRDIAFINARDILGIIYSSKSGNTRLKWRQTRGKYGRVIGEASTNSLVNLFSARVLSEDFVKQFEKGEVPQVREKDDSFEETEEVEATEGEAEPFSDEGATSSTSESQEVVETLHTADDV